MGQTTNEALQGKLFFDLLGNSDELLEKVRRRLALDFSDIACESSIISSSEEAPLPGAEAGLRRLWITTERPVHLFELAEIKRFTSKLELSFAASGSARPAIDPGYVTVSKVVRIASVDAEHRVFLSPGAYGEPLLQFTSRPTLVGWPWTPADYLTPAADDFFIRTRQLLLEAQSTEPVQKV